MVRKRKAGRPRSDISHEAILVATMEILFETGYRGLTLQMIAARAGVGRQTLYRWWNTKADIVLEAFADRADRDIPVPDTGQVSNDLIELLKASGRVLEESTGPVVLGLLAEAALDEKFAAKFWTNFQMRRRKVFKTILERGVERGELAPDLDKDFWADIFFGILLYRLYSRNAPLDGKLGEDLSRLLCPGPRSR